MSDLKLMARQIIATRRGISVPEVIGAMTAKDRRIAEWKARHAVEALLESGVVEFDVKFRLYLVAHSKAS